MSIEEKDKTPFKRTLVHNNFSTFDYEHIKALEGDHSKVLRRDFYGRDKKEWTLSDKIERQKIAKELFKELQNKYGIAVPSIDYVVGHHPDNSDPEIYTVTDNIEGVGLEDLYKQNKKLSKDMMADLCTSLIDYFQDKYQNGGHFLSDIISIEQYVYGHKHSEGGSRIYLIDIEPNFSEYNALSRKMNLEMYSSIMGFSTFIRDCEMLAGDLFSLRNVRERFGIFYESIASNDPMREMKGFRHLSTP